MNYKIKINTKTADKMLERISKKSKDMTRVMASISLSMLSAVEENFDKQGRPKWTPLKEATILRRIKKGKGNNKILQISGVLAGANTPSHGRKFARVTNNQPYAAAQNFGYPARNLPARPFLSLTSGEMDDIVDMIETYYNED